MKRILNFILNIFILFFIGIILTNSSDIFLACKDGIQLWFNIIFPSLFPFIVTINLLTNSSLIQYLNIVFTPIMYPLFKVRGIGSIAFILGNLSGFPLGAKVISNLKNQNLITSVEAQRLISFCNNCGLVFIISAVCTNMLNNSKLGWYIIFIQFISSVSVGILFRFYKGSNQSDKSIPVNQNVSSHTNINFAKLLTQSISNALETILNIGGFVIFFSVFIKFMQLSKIKFILDLLFSPLELALNLDPNLNGCISLGLVELTNGISYVANTFSPLWQKVLLINLFINWGSFSIHSQTLNVIKDTKINFKLYLFSKILQSIFAIIYSLVFNML